MWVGLGCSWHTHYSPARIASSVDKVAATIITDTTLFHPTRKKPPLTIIMSSVVPVRRDNWEEEEVRTLLDLWKDAHVQSELDGSGRNISIYRRLADRLVRICGSAKGDRTAESCHMKFSLLLQWIWRALNVFMINASVWFFTAGMFTYDKKSKVFWFSTSPCETYQEFNLVGVVSFTLHRNVHWTGISYWWLMCIVVT